MNRPPIMSPMYPVRRRVLTTLNGVIALVICSLVLQLVGGFTPGWFVMDSSTGVAIIHLGLWYARLCALGGDCVTSTLVGSSATVHANFELGPYRGLTITGIVMCFCAAVVLLYNRSRLQNPSGQNVQVALGIGGFLALVSGVLSVAAAARLGDLTRKWTDTVVSAGFVSPYGFPYSLVITGVGGLLAMLACLAFLASRPWEMSAESQQPPVQTQPYAQYPAQVATVQTGYQTQYTNVNVGYQPPPMYAMSALPTENGQNQ